jgi:hypothetical protein
MVWQIVAEEKDKTADALLAQAEVSTLINIPTVTQPLPTWFVECTAGANYNLLSDSEPTG